MNGLIEKQAIEKGTAQEFLALYNKQNNSHYEIERLADAPDVVCKDTLTNEKICLEITLLEDVQGDAGYLLGRLDHPKSKSGLPARSFTIDTLSQLIESVIDKSKKDYGRNVALVLKQVSGIPWDFGLELEDIKSKIDISHNPYDKGIWVLSVESKIYRLDD